MATSGLSNGAAARLRILWRSHQQSCEAGERNDPAGRHRGYQPKRSPEHETTRRLDRRCECLTAHHRRLDRHREEIDSKTDISCFQNEANDTCAKITELAGRVDTWIGNTQGEFNELSIQLKQHRADFDKFLARADTGIVSCQNVINELAQAVRRLEDMVALEEPVNAVTEDLAALGDPVNTVDTTAEEEPAEAESDTGSVASTDAGIYSEALVNAARRSLSPAVTGRRPKSPPRDVDTRPWGYLPVPWKATYCPTGHL